MAIRKANVKIENSKVMFSNEILEYFNNLRTHENLEWIKEYFKILSDVSNFNSEKFRIHHIRPAFTFKDENHKNRKETEKLANVFNENKIKLSITNHIKAHYCLWKIFNNWDSKNAVQKLCKMENLENLTIDEINEISKIENYCAKENQTKEEKDEYDKKYRMSHKQEMAEYCKKRRKEKKNELKEKGRKYRLTHKQEIAKYRKEHNEEHKAYMIIWRKNHKKERAECKRKWDMRMCLDPIKKDVCSFCALKKRINTHRDLYNNLDAKNCIIKDHQQSETTIFNL